METQNVSDVSLQKTAVVSVDLFKLVLPKYCYAGENMVKATVIREVQKSGHIFYLCEFLNGERKWICDNFCWISEKYIGIAENVVYRRFP